MIMLLCKRPLSTSCRSIPLLLCSRCDLSKQSEESGDMLVTGWSEAHVAASVACLNSVLPPGVGVAVTTPMPCYRTLDVIVCAGVCAPVPSW